MKTQTGPTNNSAPPSEAIDSKIYSAPKRFDVSTLMVVTVAYAFLFMLTSTVAGVNNSASVWASAIIGLFLAYIAIAQIVLFKGDYPRFASVVAGAAAFSLTVFAEGAIGIDNNGIWNSIAMAFLAGVFFGAPVGYFAGATVGGVFLISDMLRRHVLSRKFRREPKDDEDCW